MTKRVRVSKLLRQSGRCAIAFLVATGITFGSGCATLFTSSSVPVQVSSDPPGANYQLGPFSGRTPDSIAIPKKSIPDFATFEMAGYERKTVPIESGITGVFWLDVLFWPGIIVDMVTGDYKTLDVPEVRATLEKSQSNETGSAVPANAPIAGNTAAATTTTASVPASPAAASDQPNPH